MIRMSYTPKPIDTSKVRISDDLLKLIELLGRNIHDVWARSRLREGWKFGSQRNEAAKEHPCLVPYEELPELEKQYDRDTALQAIKVILAIGYCIQSPDSSVSPSAEDVKADVRMTLDVLRSPESVRLKQLREIWDGRSGRGWTADSEVYRRLAAHALRVGEAFLAYDIAAEGIRRFVEDVKLLQIQALALARSGSTHRAQQLLEELRRIGHHDEETLGILARTHKDFGLLSSDPQERAARWRLSQELYAEAFERSQGYYAGINAASMALLLGKNDIAHRTAQRVRGIIEDKIRTLPAQDEERYWLEATLGECAVILGDRAQARLRYCAANGMGQRRLADLSSTRRQARLLLQSLGGSANALDDCFAIPSMIVFQASFLDGKVGGSTWISSPSTAGSEERLRARLKELNPGMGFASLATESDFVFVEWMLEHGKETHFVLPVPVSQLADLLGQHVPGVDWKTRLNHCLERADSIVYASDQVASDPLAALDYGYLLIKGLATLKAEMLGADVLQLSILKEGKGEGEQENHMVASKQNAGELWSAPRPRAARASSVEGVEVGEFKQEVRAILFADIVGYSSLGEPSIPLYIRHFLSAIAGLLASSPNAPIIKNTWEDALYFVFETTRDAGLLALKIRDLISGTKWEEKGLPASLNIRIALHVGPVFPCFDPIISQASFTGRHVNRTARIEPITEEGQIFASQEFAAIASAEGISEFTCHYVGQKALPKGFGSFPIYLVR